VAKLLESAERIGFFGLRISYRGIQNPDGTVIPAPTDMPTKIVGITANGHTKSVENYFGAPDTLDDFEREIDQTAGTVRWIFLDETELAALLRSGWSAATDEGARFLQEAIERDDVAIARRLVEMGADVGGPAQNRLPPLVSARSKSMVELLVKSGADPNERPVGRVAARTPLMAAYYRDVSVAEALLNAGARLEDMDDGRTALWYTACAGNWRVVTLLLAAGANPRGSAGISAVECTRQARESRANRPRTLLDRGLPTVEDFDRVIALLEKAQKQ
jgi:hypothetical protein